MEAATPLPLSQVYTRGDKLVVDGLQVDDETAVRLAREREEAGEDVAKLVVDAIEIGARVLDREQTGANADFVRAEFEKTSREVETAFTERAAGVGEQLAKQLETVFDPQSGLLARELERRFSDGSSEAVQNRVKEIVTELMARAREDMLRQFSAADGRNPLADFKNASINAIRDASTRQDKHMTALNERIAALEARVAAQLAQQAKEAERAEAEEAGTRKGRTFEEAVYDALDQIAAAQGDACDAVGDLKGATGKVGDVVVEIGACAGPARGRIVFEAKNARLTRPKALAELDEALVQRDADFAVLVVPSEDKLPARMQQLREQNGDKMIVTFDPEEGSTLALQLAYSLARARVLMSRSGADGIDAAALHDTAQRAVDALGEVKRVKSQLTGATTSIENARGILEAMERAVREQLEQITALVTVGEEDSVEE